MTRTIWITAVPSVTEILMELYDLNRKHYFLDYKAYALLPILSSLFPHV